MRPPGDHYPPNRADRRIKVQRTWMNVRQNYDRSTAASESAAVIFTHLAPALREGRKSLSIQTSLMRATPGKPGLGLA